MNRKTSTRGRSIGIARRSLLSVSLLLGLGTVASPALADWAVSDKEAQTRINNLKTEVHDRLTEIYKQSHVKGSQLDFKQTDTKTKTLQDDNDSKLSTRSDASTLQTSRCRTEEDNAVSTQQNEICKDVITKQEKLNNYLVDMLKLMTKRQEQLQSLVDEREKIKDGDEKEFGQLASNTNQLLALQAQLQIDRMNLQLTMDSYSRYFADQDAKVSDLARNLQRGDQNTASRQITDGARLATLQLVLAGLRSFPTNAQSSQ